MKRLIIALSLIPATGLGFETSQAPAAAAECPVIASVAAHEDNGLMLRVFDEAWQRVNDTHFDDDFGGTDWQAVREELRPEAAEADSMDEIRQIIRNMLDRLGQSHFAILPSEAADALDDDEEPDRFTGRPGHPGFQVRLIDDEIVITHVEPDLPAEQAGVRPGWILTAVRQREVSDLLEALPEELDDRNRAFLAWRMIESRLTGPRDSSIHLALLDASDEAVELDLPRGAVRGQPASFGNLPTSYARLDHERVSIGENGTTVGVLRFNIWMLQLIDALAEAMVELRDADGIVIDLRGNTGGIGGMTMATAGYFTDESFSLGTMKNRATEIEFRAVPQFSLPDGEAFEPYDGPVAILIDELSASTSEIFAAGMQAAGRARVFGSKSLGAALPSAMYRLSNGDVLQHAIADFISPDGTRIEGRGVKPDHTIILTRANWLAGEDPAMDAALAWLRSAAQKKNGVTAGSE